MARHNKKRNVGLIYELLVRRLSHAIVEGDKKTAAVVKKILVDRFKAGTELYKEFRLFNAIVKTGGLTEQLAFRVIDEAKSAASDHEPTKLSREKSLLIKDINYRINESNFYDSYVDNYPVYASTQQLLNAWRGKQHDIHESAMHEKTVHSWLTRSVVEKTLDDERTPAVNDITLRIMKEKLEKKYANQLNETQLKIIKAYATNDPTVSTLIQETVDAAQRKIDKYVKGSADPFLAEKVKSVKATLSEQKLVRDADSVSRALTLQQLATELEELIDG